MKIELNHKTICPGDSPHITPLSSCQNCLGFNFWGKVTEQSVGQTDKVQCPLIGIGWTYTVGTYPCGKGYTPSPALALFIWGRIGSLARKHLTIVSRQDSSRGGSTTLSPGKAMSAPIAVKFSRQCADTGRCPVRDVFSFFAGFYSMK